MTDQERLLRLEALLHLQIADQASLLLIVERLAAFVGRTQPGFPPVIDAFLHHRKAQLHAQLEALEQTQPALAAQLQSMIDASSQ